MDASRFVLATLFLFPCLTSAAEVSPPREVQVPFGSRSRKQGLAGDLETAETSKILAVAAYVCWLLRATVIRLDCE